jgi:hypothetical protein
MEFIPFLVGEGWQQLIPLLPRVHSSFVFTRPRNQSWGIWDLTKYIIIKKSLRSRMSFTPGNGISNEVPSNCGISIEVSRRTLSSLLCLSAVVVCSSLLCLSAVVVCAFVVDVLFCCCCCCVDPVSFAYFERQTALSQVFWCRFCTAGPWFSIRRCAGSFPPSQTTLLIDFGSFPHFKSVASSGLPLYPTFEKKRRSGILITSW